MSVTHNTTVRNALCDTITTQLGASPKMVLQTSGGVAVATLPMSATPFPAGAGGSMTANAITSDTNAAGGTATKGELQTSAGTQKVLYSVTATGGGGDVQMNSTAVSAGQTVACSSLVYTGPA
jgi:hypothetical protein